MCVCVGGEFHLSSKQQLSCMKALLRSGYNLDCLAHGRSDAPASWGAFSPGLGSDQAGAFHHPIQYLSTILSHMAPWSSAPTSIPHSPPGVLVCPLPQTTLSSSMDLPCSSPLPVLRVLGWGGAWRRAGVGLYDAGWQLRGCRALPDQRRILAEPASLLLGPVSRAPQLLRM